MPSELEYKNTDRGDGYMTAVAFSVVLLANSGISTSMGTVDLGSEAQR
jgi:hypothetical protein